MAELGEPRLLAQLQNLRKQSGEGLQPALAEIRNRAEVRRVGSMFSLTFIANLSKKARPACP